MGIVRRSERANSLTSRAAARPAGLVVPSGLIAGCRQFDIRSVSWHVARMRMGFAVCMLRKSSKMCGLGSTVLAPWHIVAGCGPCEWRAGGAERSIQVHRFDNDPPRLPIDPSRCLLQQAWQSRFTLAKYRTRAHARIRVSVGPPKRIVVALHRAVVLSCFCFCFPRDCASYSCWRGALSLVRRPALDRIVSRSSCPNLLDNTPPISSQPSSP